MDGDRWPAVALGLLILVAVQASRVDAQTAPPSSFPGHQAPTSNHSPRPAPAQPTAAPGATARPAPPSREPFLGANEHTCETLFEGEDDGLDEGEECFRDPQVRWRWQLAFFTGPTRTSAWDESLALRGYGPSDVLYGGETSLVRQFGTYLGVGLRTGVRDLRWLHFERPAASVFGWDLLLLGELRLPIGRKKMAMLGVDVGAGLGLAFSSVNEESTTDVGWRVQAGALFGLRLVGPAALIVRLGYDHFPVTIGDTLDAKLGGFRFSLGLEVRE